MSAAISLGAGLAIAGGVGAIGTVIAGSEAASATTNATNAAIAEENNALQQQATLSQPYRDLGTSAIPLYQSLLGLGGGSPDTIQKALESDPAYQFTKSQGEQGIVNQASAQGGISGNTLADLDKFNSGLADETYQSVLGDVQGAVGLGQAAAAGQAANIGSAAGNIASLTEAQGQTTAGIDASTIAGLTKSLSQPFDTMLALKALNSQVPGAAAGGT